tara:strand:+ start:2668 stop:3081 length:414 start_codon:yes stop_codon:yes gene_type:complete
MSEDTGKSKPSQLTEKQKVFLDALVGEAQGNHRKAMEIAGYSPNTSVQDVVKNMKDEIIERASMVLAMNAPAAAFGMVGVLNDPTTMGARNAIQAAKEIMDRTGLIKKDVVELKTEEGGLFVLPPKGTTDYDQTPST